MTKAIGWIVMAEHGMVTGLGKPPGKDMLLPPRVKEVLFLGGRATLFPSRKSAQRAIDNREAFDDLNSYEGIRDMRIVALYEPPRRNR